MKSILLLLLILTSVKSSNAQDDTTIGEILVRTFSIGATTLVSISAMSTWVITTHEEELPSSMEQQEIIDQILEMKANGDEDLEVNLFEKRYPNLFRYQERLRSRSPIYVVMSRAELSDFIFEEFSPKRTGTD